MRNRNCLAAILAIGLLTGLSGFGAAQTASVQPSSTAPPADAQTVDQTPLPSADMTNGTSSPYRIGVDDVITISVWHEPDLSRNVPVRPDGKISLPLVGDVQAAGRTAMGLQAELKTDLAKFVKDPELTVIVSDIRSRRINVIGQVNRPGAYALTQSMGVVDAIAAASGLRDFAKTKDIYVLRETSDGKRLRLSFSYQSVVKGKKGAQDIILLPRDTVVVP